MNKKVMSLNEFIITKMKKAGFKIIDNDLFKSKSFIVSIVCTIMIFLNYIFEYEEHELNLISLIIFLILLMNKEKNEQRK